jgi:hypothetical protein
MKKFDSTLYLGDGGVPSYIELPFDPKHAFGKTRAPVRGTINGAPYRSTVAVYGGHHYLVIRREMREAAGLAKHGDLVRVEIELDDEVRTVEPPPDLRRALSGNPLANTGWKALSYTHQKEWVLAIEGAKKPETRTRRVQQALEAAIARGKPDQKPRSPRKRGS